jgi:hypothetical protein
MATIDDGNLIRKDPDARLPIDFDWDADLAPNAVILTSAWVVVPVKPSLTDTALLVDTEAIDSDGRGTSMRLTGGTLGQWYKVTNRVESNEVTAPLEDRFTYILIQ